MLLVAGGFDEERVLAMTLGQLDAAAMSLLRTRRDRLAEEAYVGMLAAQGSPKELTNHLNALRGIKKVAKKGDLAAALGIKTVKAPRKGKAK